MMGIHELRGLRSNRRNISSVSLAAAAGLLLLFSVYLTVTFYIRIKSSFFDDAFIYLHMARNAVLHVTWQYFPLVDRPALLASSPLQLCVLTLATFFLSVFGVSAKSLITAKLVFLVGGLIAYLAFGPIWRHNKVHYLFIGIIYFFLASVFDTILEFEGGLLFLWLLSLLLLASGTQIRRPKELSAVLPLGILIRPEFAIIIYSMMFIGWYKHKLLTWKLLRTMGIAAVSVAVVWVVLCAVFHVYPIPITWWAKAAIPHLFSEENLIQSVFENLGITLTWPLRLSDAARAAVGAGVIMFAVATAYAGRRRRLLEFLVCIALCILLATKLPSNFWWYYQNIIVLLCAYAFAVSFLSADADSKQKLIAKFYLCFLLVLPVFHYRVNSSLPWNFRPNATSRAQGYLYLASRVQPNGTYNLPGLGDVLIKGPEIGIIAYFSGETAWEWDSAGLAQVATNLGALKSPLKWFYPRSLWKGPGPDALSIAQGKPLKIIEVWGTEDRDMAAMKKKCQYIIDAGAICANSFSTLP